VVDAEARRPGTLADVVEAATIIPISFVSFSSTPVVTLANESMITKA
jgi:hypothetical protein